MLDALFHLAHQLSRDRTPYALAVVVRHEPPISGKAGDKAIILADGHLAGWIGGGCTKPLIIAEARKALIDEQSRLVRITPDTEAEAKGMITHTMTCHSGGALDIYIEPVMPKPQLIIVGRTELARALCRLASTIKYHVVVMAPDASLEVFEDAAQVETRIDFSCVNLAGPTFVVVATQGEQDTEALHAALALDLDYLAFVASRRKAAAIFKSLVEDGVDEDQLSRIKTPAGLDIKARLPEEIALSILAEIVATHRSQDFVENPTSHSSDVRETLSIEGMSCAHCVMTVRQALEAVPGLDVHDVRVGQAEVSFTDAKACRKAVVRALENVGFSMHS